MPPAALSSDVVVLPLAAIFIILVDEFIVGFAAASVVGDAARFAIVVDIIVTVTHIDVIAWSRSLVSHMVWSMVMESSSTIALLHSRLDDGDLGEAGDTRLGKRGVVS